MELFLISDEMLTREGHIVFEQFNRSDLFKEEVVVQEVMALAVDEVGSDDY